jgi:hypothetical protein
MRHTGIAARRGHISREGFETMRNLRKFWLGMMMFVPSVCHGQAKCPWIDEATARGILGAAVTAKVNIKDTSYGGCEFSRQEGEVRRQLSVVVIVMTDIRKQFSTYVTQCESKATPLRKIGDEAIMCSIQTHTNLYAEKVVGRVRDRAFNVSVASGVQDDPSMTQETRREKVQLAAEQVAGVLLRQQEK